MKIVFSDLDGTVLDRRTYGYERSLAPIGRLKQNRIPLLFCSSKTRAEMDSLRKELGVTDPFAVENGSAVLIPEGYFRFDAGEEHEGLIRIELAERLEAFEARLGETLDSAGVGYTTFEKMSAEEVSRDSGLGLGQAEEARKREYTMTLKFPNEAELQAGRRAISSSGLTCYAGGWYLTVGGGGCKGKAVRALKGLFARAFGDVVSYALGDGENDVSMFKEVDVPFLVQSSQGTWTEVGLEAVRRIPFVGPEGFAAGVEEIVGPSAGSSEPSTPTGFSSGEGKAPF